MIYMYQYNEYGRIAQCPMHCENSRNIIFTIYVNSIKQHYTFSYHGLLNLLGAKAFMKSVTC